MRTRPIQIELTTNEIVAISAAILIAKQAVFGYELDQMATQMVINQNEDLVSAGVKLGNVLRALQMGDMGV
jgi:hypothetical protein